MLWGLLEPLDELFGRQHARALLLVGDGREQVPERGQKALVVILRERLVVLEDRVAKRLAEVERLQDRVGVASVPEVLQAVVPLAVRVRQERLVQLGRAVPLRRKGVGSGVSARKIVRARDGSGSRRRRAGLAVYRRARRAAARS